MSDMTEWGGFRIIGIAVVALIVLGLTWWLLGAILLPLFAVVLAVLLGLASLLAGVLQYVIFIALVGAIIYGILYLFKVV
jgi:hypothetical protein